MELSVGTGGEVCVGGLQARQGSRPPRAFKLAPGRTLRLHGGGNTPEDGRSRTAALIITIFHSKLQPGRSFSWIGYERHRRINHNRLPGITFRLHAMLCVRASISRDSDTTTPLNLRSLRSRSSTTCSEDKHGMTLHPDDIAHRLPSSHPT